MRRDQHTRWSGAPVDNDGGGMETQPGLPTHTHMGRTFAGRAVESLPPQLQHIPRRWALAGICAVLLIAIVLGTLLAAAHAGNGAGSKRVSSGGTGVAGKGAQVAPTGGATGTQALQLPPGIPNYFSFGVMNQPGDVGLLDDMRTRNGTAWDYRYQYLAGGVNTGSGWETWNSPAGAFASYYMRESASHHYIPAFVYYEMLRSHGTCSGCGESDTDLANLNNSAVMAAYFANWRLLMRQIGSFGGPVLVIVEPDLWGYMQRAAFSKGNTPAAVPASVAGSGDTDAQGLPNTAQGYAWALLHIRDLYAPNAVLALHVSFWSTGSDIGSSTDPNLDVAGTAQLTAQFLEAAGLTGNPAGISSWELLSSDVADRDSGQGASWWDPTNAVFPNFARYLSYIGDITRATGKKVVMWQVPEGNQYFDTENNTPHHTQDNRTAYILGHVGDFARAGIIGVLFGPGNGGTSIDDAAHDGVTNPAPISGFQCAACDTHISTYPDDDGGYLRLFVGAYYQHGPLLLANPNAWTPATSPDASATATPAPQGACTGQPVVSIGATSATPDPVRAGQQVTFSTYVTVNCNTAALVYVEVSNPGIRVTQVVRDNIRFAAGQAQQVTISGVMPAGTKSGTYVVRVGVFGAGWGPEYAWSNEAATIDVQ